MIPAEWLQYAPKPRALNQANKEQWNVFLSYRSVNRTWVLSLYDILVELGYKVFIDQCELSPGESLIFRLGEALKRSQAGVLIWSHQASESKWVFKEYERLETMSSENPDFHFVPIKLDKTDLPEFADSKIFIDFSSYPDGPNGGELIRLVHGIVGKPMDPSTVRFANEQNASALDAAREIEAAVRNGYPEDIIQLAETDSLPWRTTPSLGCKAAESLIKLKKYSEAVCILEKLEERFPKAVRPKQLHALALARTSAGTGEKEYLKQAQRILGKLYEQGERDPETLGIYARTWMDRFNLSNNNSDLEQSRNYYAEAFAKAPDDYYTGINAAAKSVLLGTTEDLEKANEFAQQVQEITGIEAVYGDYWKTATIAELFLIQKKYEEAGKMYKQAISMAVSEIASHESTFTQAAKLMQKLHPTNEEKLLVIAPFKHLADYAKVQNETL